MSCRISSTLAAAFTLAAIERNSTADTTRAGIALAEPPGAAQGSGDGLLGARGDDEGLVVAGLGGVTEDHLAQVDAPVTDMGAVACDDRSDDRHHRTQGVGCILGLRPALLQGFGVQGVSDGYRP
ncbi:hypothetical protein DMA15_30165 [Streptomyces sp. WAC 01529]|nr:hypothetical protein DMA15_30165 [Streptomyces sp. WAC 01529]